MLRINYVNEFDQKRSYFRVIKHILKKAYKQLDIFDSMIVNVVLVNDATIREMNKQYRSIDIPTDVLSFENQDGLSEIGDIIISVDKAREQAKSYGHSFERELAFLSLHGFLHCLGYDHLVPEDEQEMNSLQDEIIDNSKYKR